MTALACAAGFAVWALPAFAVPTYTVTVLGTLGRPGTTAKGINASGLITGQARNAANQTRAFLFDGTTMQDIGTLGGTSSTIGNAINASGSIAGTSPTAGGQAHAFLYNGTTMQDLGTLGGTTSSGLAINASGQVAGTSVPSGANPLIPTRHAFIYDGSAGETSARWGAEPSATATPSTTADRSRVQPSTRPAHSMPSFMTAPQCATLARSADAPVSAMASTPADRSWAAPTPPQPFSTP